MGLIPAHAAVHVQRLPGDEAGLLRDQEKAGVGDILTLSHAADWNERAQAVGKCRGHR